MTEKKSDNVVESRDATVVTDQFGNKTVTPKPLADYAATQNDLGQTILSQEVRDQQKAMGYVPDIQPKSAAPAMTPITGVTGTAPAGVGGMQPTGNILVAAAASVSDAQAISDNSPVPDALGVEGGAKLPKDKQLVGDDPSTAVTEAEAKKAAK